MKNLKQRTELKSAYGQLYTELSALLREGDTIQLIVAGAPKDEYDPEVSTILPRLKDASSKEDVQTIVHEEFTRWFGAEIAGPKTQYAQLADKIWRVWKLFESRR